MMKSLSIARIAAIFTLFCALPVTEIISQGQKTQKYYSAPEQEFIKKTFLIAVMALQQIDQVVEQLALLVNKHQIKDIPADHILRILGEDRQLLGSLLQSAFSIPQEPEIQLQCATMLLHICDLFIPHIEQGLQHNLKKMIPFNPEIITKRSIDFSQLSPHDLDEMIRKIGKKIEQLTVNAGKAGLTWFNLFARSIDTHFVTRWNKYYGSTIAKGLGGAALLLSYIAWKDGASFPEDSIIKSVHKSLVKFGIPLYRSSQNGELVYNAAGIGHKEDPADGKRTIISLTDFAWNEIASGHAPVAMLGASTLWNFYSDTWKGSVGPWFNQKISLYWNKARGGSYLNAETPGLFYLEPKVNFDHMVGLEEVKESFKSILEYLDNPEKFLRSGNQPETGWILTGPTRTGKSFSFECLCGEIVRMQKRKGIQPNFNFIKIGIEEIAKVGIETILAYAKDHAPMIIFIDEIDLLGLQRVGDNKLLHTFLTALQSTQTDDPSKVVIVMAATNCPEMLDKALRQYGRFGKEIRFEYPSFKYRKQYLIKEINAMALNPHSFDIDSIVARTNGKSYEELKAILRRAMTNAWTLNIPLTQGLIEESIDTELYKIIMHDRKELPENETNILASHFAGKALAMTLLNTHEKLDKVTTKAVMTELQEITAWHTYGQKDKKDVQQKIVHGKLFTKYMHDTIELKTEEHVINEVKVLIAGFVAEEILLGSCGMQCHAEDNNRAYSILDQFVFKGIDPSQLSKAVREQLRDKAYALLTQCKKEIRELLENNREALAAIMQELLKDGILSDKQVQAVVDNTRK